jgi:hypothetical protein
MDPSTHAPRWVWWTVLEGVKHQTCDQLAWVGWCLTAHMRVGLAATASPKRALAAHLCAKTGMLHTMASCNICVPVCAPLPAPSIGCARPPP